MGQFYVDKSAVDSTTGAQKVIDYAHREVHAGSHYMYTDSVPLNSA